MQLVYFWMEKSPIDLENLKKLGINFSSNFQFELKIENEKYILERKYENEKYIPNNFFDEGISNISCIIGNNGSGKTNLIKSILYFYKNIILQYQIDFKIPKYIFVFRKESKFNIYTNFESQLDVILKETVVINETEEIKKFAYLYISTSINTNLYSNGFEDNIYDVSLTKKLSDISLETSIVAKKYFIHGKSIIKEYQKTLFKNTLDFIMKDIISKQIRIENIPFKELSSKLFKIATTGNIICTFNSKFFSLDDVIYRELYLKINLDIHSENNFFNDILIKIWQYIVFKVVCDIKDSKITKELKNSLSERDVTKSIKEWIINSLNIILNYINEYFSKIEEKKEWSYFTRNLYLNTYDVEAIKNIIFNLSSLPENNFFSDGFYFNYQDNKDLFNELFNWFSGYSELYFLEFEEKLSNGETEFLNLIIDLNKKQTNLMKVNNIIIFLEELEAFMHPEWQRRIIEFLPQLKKCLPWLENKNIQIILTSHTPFIVGDLPEKNIILLNKNNKSISTTKTFGSNIYDLFKDDFLLESCFGEFSRKKIKKVIDLLSKDKEDKYNTEEIEKNIAEIEFIIDSIGEPLIKNRLERMYNEYKEFKNEKTIKNADFYTYLKKNNLNLDDVLKILEERKNDKTI